MVRGNLQTTRNNRHDGDELTVFRQNQFFFLALVFSLHPDSMVKRLNLYITLHYIALLMNTHRDILFNGFSYIFKACWWNFVFQNRCAKTDVPGPWHIFTSLCLLCVFELRTHLLSTKTRSSSPNWSSSMSLTFASFATASGRGSELRGLSAPEKEQIL